MPARHQLLVRAECVTGGQPASVAGVLLARRRRGCRLERSAEVLAGFIVSRHAVAAREFFARLDVPALDRYVAGAALRQLESRWLLRSAGCIRLVSRKPGLIDPGVVVETGPPRHVVDVFDRA